MTAGELLVSGNPTTVPARGQEEAAMKAVIEPARVIQERKKIGLHPSCPVPAGAILCYNTMTI